MLAQWLKHPLRLELRIVDYKSTVLPIELQVQNFPISKLSKSIKKATVFCGCF